MAVSKAARHAPIGAADDPILQMLYFYHFVTAVQVTRLLYSPGYLTGVQTKLKRLADAGVLQRGPRFQTPGRGGSAATVYSLGRLGLNYLAAQGKDVRGRFRASEEREKSELFIRHTLAVNDVFIAAELLCKRDSRITIANRVHERTLKVLLGPIDVTRAIAGSLQIQKRSVVPDGWIDFHVSHANGAVESAPVVLELDRGTIEQRDFRAKIAGLLAWMDGPYEEQFGTSLATIAFLTTAGQKRLHDLLHWTEAELEIHSSHAFGQLCCFAACQPDLADPEALFLSPIWAQPFSAASTVLLEIH